MPAGPAPLVASSSQSGVTITVTYNCGHRSSAYASGFDEALMQKLSAELESSVCHQCMLVRRTLIHHPDWTNLP